MVTKLIRFLTFSFFLIFNSLVSQCQTEVGIQFCISPALSKSSIPNYNKVLDFGPDLKTLYESNGMPFPKIGYVVGGGLFLKYKKVRFDLSYYSSKRGQQSCKQYNINGFSTYPPDYDGYLLTSDQFSKEINLNTTYFYTEHKVQKLNYLLNFGLAFDWTNNYFLNFFTYSKMNGITSYPTDKLTIYFSYPAQRVGFLLGWGINYTFTNRFSLQSSINYRIYTNIINKQESSMPNGIIQFLELKNMLSFRIL